MIVPLAVGIDLVDIHRIEQMLERHGGRALHKLLTQPEQRYCNASARPAQHVAVRVAAKEAAYKALQQAGNARAIGWLDSEVVLADDGRPTLDFHGSAASAAGRLGVATVLLSLTHSSTTAGAVVILAGNAE